MINGISFLIAFGITVICIGLLRPLAIRLNLVDSPAGRKQHHGDIPLIGGIAMFLGFLFALLTLPISLESYRSFIAGSALLVFIGVLDDFHELPARSRLEAQVIAALLMIFWGKVRLIGFGDITFFGNVILGLWSVPITLLAVVGVINAMNMVDGVDGLAGCLALVPLASLILLAGLAGQLPAMQILATIIAALLAFLCFNFRFPHRKQAMVFMGDAGSMFLGYALVWFLIDLSQTNHQVAKPVTMLYLLALPLFDVIGVMLQRLRKRQSILLPDREHLHHLLLNRGLKPVTVTLMMTAMAIILAGFGIAGDIFGVAEAVMFYLFLSLFGLYWLIVSSFRKQAIEKAPLVF